MFLLPNSTVQVSVAVKCLRGAAIPFVVRGGGHSFTGMSILDKGAVLELSRLTTLTVDTAKGTATIGAGQRLGHLYLALYMAGNYTFPAGSCVSVGVSGHLAGGGYGLFRRLFGFASDNVLSFTAVQANEAGTIVQNVNLNDNTKAALFHAVMGGGGNFVIITEWTVKIFKAPESLFVFSRHCPATVANAKALSAAMFGWRPWEEDARFAQWHKCQQAVS